MSGLNTAANTEAIRVAYSRRIKEDFVPNAQMRPHVLWDPDFLDGQTLNVLTKGQPVVRTRNEGQPGVYDPVSTGTFLLNEKNRPFTGFEMTDEFSRDSWKANSLRDIQTKDMGMALDRYLDSTVFLLHKSQTSNSPNTINGQPHRLVAAGAGATFDIATWAQIDLSFNKANVPGSTMGFVDPTVKSQITQDANFQRQDFYGSNVTLKAGALVPGSETTGGIRYLGMIYDIAIFTSNLLDETTALNHVAGGTQTANIFIRGTEAFIGHFRKEPELEAHRDQKSKKWLWDLEAEFYLELYRPESLVVVLSA